MNITVLESGLYKLNEPLPYHSKRYGKTITAIPGIYDGATGPFIPDLMSRSWIIHDHICRECKWDDCTPITAWQAARILGDLLYEERRYIRSATWAIMTFLFGCTATRKNGWW